MAEDWMRNPMYSEIAKKLRGSWDQPWLRGQMQQIAGAIADDDMRKRIQYVQGLMEDKRTKKGLELGEKKLGLESQRQSLLQSQTALANKYKKKEMKDASKYGDVSNILAGLTGVADIYGGVQQRKIDTAKELLSRNRIAKLTATEDANQELLKRILAGGA